MLATRPNAIPPAVTIGSGPNGRKTIYYQVPEVGAPAPEAEANADGRNQQYCTMLNAIETAKAVQHAANPVAEPLLAMSNMDTVADKENRPPMTPKPASTALMAKHLLTKQCQMSRRLLPDLLLKTHLSNCQGKESLPMFGVLLTLINQGEHGGSPGDEA